MKSTILLLGMCTTHLFLAAQLINKGATIVVSPGTHLVLENLSLQNNGVFNQTGGTVLFTGKTNAFISGSNTPAFYNLQLNKPSATLQLQTGITVNHELQFNGGLLQLNSNTVLLDAAGLLTGESESSHITASSGGYVQITKILNAPSAENPGNLGVLITSSQNLGSVTIRRGHQLLSGITDRSSSVLRYYDISASNNASINATLRFKYLDAELNGLTENDLVLWKTNGVTDWTDLGRSSGSTSSNFVEQKGINNFSRFAFSMPSINLPANWSSLNTECGGNGVRIAWKTETEQNTASFTILRSTDKRSWIPVGTVPAAGSSNTSHSYSFTDLQSPSGTVYYRVQRKDLNGRLSFSSVLSNNCGIKEAFNVFPNPVRQNCWIQVQSENTATVVLGLYDHKGALVQQRREILQQGNNQFELTMAQLSAGTYALTVSWSDGKTKIVKLEKY
jgi:hypothetical protein